MQCPRLDRCSTVRSDGPASSRNARDLSRYADSRTVARPLDASGSFVEEPAPASSLYHLVGAVLALSRLTERLAPLNTESMQNVTSAGARTAPRDLPGSGPIVVHIGRHRIRQTQGTSEIVAMETGLTTVERDFYQQHGYLHIQGLLSPTKPRRTGRSATAWLTAPATAMRHGAASVPANKAAGCA